MKNPAVVVTAPGKVILFGEHSVVYGRKALAASVEKRMKVKLFHHNIIQLDLLDLNHSKQWDVQVINSLFESFNVCEDEIKLLKLNDELVTSLKNFLKITSSDCSQYEKASLSFLYLLAVIYGKRIISGMRLEVQSSIPVGAGLGSSASYLVCLAGTLLVSSGDIKCTQGHGDGITTPSADDLKLINSHAFLAEHIFHGRPSGLDNMISVHGDAMVYFGHENFIKCGDLPEIKIVVIDTNVSRSTKTQVDKARQRWEKYPSIVNHVFDAMHHITERGEGVLRDLAGQASLDDESRKVLNELIDMNQFFLNSLGVGHPKIDEVIEAISKFNIHGKLTGAGGGGSVIGLMPPDMSSESLTRMLEACQSLGFTCHLTSLGAKGVTITRN